MERAACFIDGGYLQKVLKSHFNEPDINHFTLVKKICGGVPLLRAYYYDCLPYMSQNPTEEDKKRKNNKENFFKRIERSPQFELRKGTLKRYLKENGTYDYVQKQVDVFMSIDIVTLSTKHLINHAKIITADSDFIPAIQRAKDEGVIVELFCVYESAKLDALLNAVDIVTKIDENFVKSIERVQ